jgi:hypothetical protein
MGFQPMIHRQDAGATLNFPCFGTFSKIFFARDIGSWLRTPSAG